MAQNWSDDSYQLGHVGTVDLQNMENNFGCLKSMFSGSSAPASVAGMPWFDTNNKVLKIRDSLNSTWLGVMYGAATNLIWIYLNSATDGWTISATGLDRVISVGGDK